jgi:hypothetical protein
MREAPCPHRGSGAWVMVTVTEGHRSPTVQGPVLDADLL